MMIKLQIDCNFNIKGNGFNATRYMAGIMNMGFGSFNYKYLPHAASVLSVKVG